MPPGSDDHSKILLRQPTKRTRNEGPKIHQKYSKQNWLTFATSTDFLWYDPLLHLSIPLLPSIKSIIINKAQLQYSVDKQGASMLAMKLWVGLFTIDKAG